MLMLCDRDIRLQIFSGHYALTLVMLLVQFQTARDFEELNYYGHSSSTQIDPGPQVIWFDNLHSEGRSLLDTFHSVYISAAAIDKSVVSCASAPVAASDASKKLDKTNCAVCLPKPRKQPGGVSFRDSGEQRQHPTCWILGIGQG